MRGYSEAAALVLALELPGEDEIEEGDKREGVAGGLLDQPARQLAG